MYQLANKKRAARLAALLQDKSDLGDSIALVRLLIEESVNQGKTSQAKGLIDSLGRLELAFQAASVKAGHLLPRATLNRVGELLGTLFLELLAASQISEDTRYQIVTGFIERVPTVIDSAVAECDNNVVDNEER